MLWARIDFRFLPRKIPVIGSQRGKSLLKLATTSLNVLHSENTLGCKIAASSKRRDRFLRVQVQRNVGDATPEGLSNAWNTGIYHSASPDLFSLAMHVPPQQKALTIFSAAMLSVGSTILFLNVEPGHALKTVGERLFYGGIAIGSFALLYGILKGPPEE